MMGIIINSYSNVSSSLFSSKMQHYIEELVVSPVSNFTILSGFLRGGVARGLAVGSLITLVAFLFTDLTITHPVVTLSVAVLTSIMFSLGGFLNGLFAKTFDDISIIPNFVLTPLTY